MPPRKRNVSVFLDRDLVERLESRDPSLSTQINEAIQAYLDREKRQQRLRESLDRLDAEYGPIDGALIARYAGLLE